LAIFGRRRSRGRRISGPNRSAWARQRRLATDEDAEQHPEDQVGISEEGLANLETQLRLGAVHEDELALVAIDGDELIGFTTAWLTRGRATPGVRGEIDWLWARPGASRHEVARRLGEEAVRWLFQRGAGAVFKMDDIDHPRRDLWESLGFEGDVIRFSRYQRPTST
jgi:GNAT superfamily N-acetyltransferase